ncbi:MAG: hypothetical protein ABR538_00350, partial [Candidatus Binatia bacterium]
MNVSTASASRWSRLRPRRLLAALALAGLAAPLLWAVPSAHAAVGFNFASSTNSEADPFSFSHTTAGVDRLLTVCVAVENNVAVSGITFNGVALTQFFSLNSGGDLRVELWRLVNPPVATANVVVNMAEGKKVVAGALSFTGVDQTTPIDIPAVSASNSATGPNVSVASAVDDMVADCLGTKKNPTTAPTVGALQTSRWNREQGGSIRGTGSTEPGAAGNVTMSWTVPTGGNPSILAGYNINAAVNNCGNGVLDGGESCDNGVSNGTAGNCCSGTCTFQPSSTVCRASAGVCDLAENCTGGSGSCPADSFEASTTTCRTSAGVCDVAETCTGNAAACPADAFQPSSVTCRGDAGICDVAEVCPGNSAACPADAFASDGSSCGSPMANACTAADSCDGNGQCQTNHEPDGTVCRAAAGSCDTEETCVDGACPADSVLGTNTVCRASAGSCDVAENCDGVSPACPADAVEDTDTVCRSSAGVCDV